MAQVMGVAVKSKWKITHTDPYSRGEQLGKKAKPDARSVAQHPIPTASTTVCPITPRPTPTLYYFDEPAINLCNTVLLQSLLCAQLNRLCKYYGVKAKGTNEDIIDALSAIV
ncbi:hypothetical protein L208DRAFT_1322137 [Tricholoma matsutake]|nr:hypothetical protein L208DRAFT_1322137 [Tricholoma matsutake 945]